MPAKTTPNGPQKLCLNCGRFISTDIGGNINPHIHLKTGELCARIEDMTLHEFYDHMKSVFDDFAVHWLQHPNYPKTLDLPEWLEQLDNFMDMK